ncbi:lysylphosphatidylglycerol synthase domain-containing protein [uncultured Lutibacter sp.]|uniref:lysylphosphatidylglycerol synthase domain-containing protein n=1 Tax=uncultured Lutibacter sp. TaxID=437739 RepID=UPI0026376054|nr:lysylphosphatidylglycerol synthase domain-containing protein [uncultured Lutibacter sp.]
MLVFGAFYFIYLKLVSNHLLSFTNLQEQLSILFSKNSWLLIFLLLFTDVNWLLEIYKWKLLVSIEKKITFFEAYQQSLASLTASIITPNRIGEYGVKALYFKKESRKKIVLLNLIGNMCQLAATTFFGLVGLLFLFTNYTIQIPQLNIEKLLILIAVISALYFVSVKLSVNITIKTYLTKITTYLKQLPTTIYVKVIGLSFLRYLVFSHQFYFLLKLLSIEIDYFTAMNLLFCIYFIASIIPSLSIFDWVIKGSVAVLIFSYIELNELTIVTITTIMWLLNFALPALLGSIFVLNFKFIDKE